VTENGDVLTFGGGEHGQLGHGDKTNRTVPCLVKALEGAGEGGRGHRQRGKGKGAVFPRSSFENYGLFRGYLVF
jgi:hypothetical protein